MMLALLFEHAGTCRNFGATHDCVDIGQFDSVKKSAREENAENIVKSAGDSYV